MKRIAGVAALLAMSLAACEDASVNRVIDGERVVVQGHTLRLHQIDAPSVADAKCEAERAAGELTEERLQGLFMAAQTLEFRKTGMACLQFMSCDALVTADGFDVGEMLVAEGLAVRSSPTEAKLDAHDWCAGPLTPPSADEANALEPAPVATPNAESGLMSAPEADAPVTETPAAETPAPQGDQ